jgi:large subunit ribosomal protein L9
LAALPTYKISKQLETMGFHVDRRSIALDDNIKALGNYKVQIKLHDGVNASIQLHVVAG